MLELQNGRAGFGLEETGSFILTKGKLGPRKGVINWIIFPNLLLPVFVTLQGLSLWTENTSCSIAFALGHVACFV